MYIAVITYTLDAIVKEQLKSRYSTYEILQIPGTSLLDKTPINQLLQKKNNQDVKDLLYNQLKFFWFKRDANDIQKQLNKPKSFR